ncbi:type II CAAX prenyl endopeptidase Rce1 family protein [Streptomyces sp. NPDC018693]|uniref:CPBP family intramembrane glutamic endopeptidase n=1 Tax=unclassified Streptomyces TaxID=2593676 RepID=UPI003799FA7A
MTITPEFGLPAEQAAPTPLPYHRLAHVTGRHRWWRPLVGTLVASVAWVVLSVVLYGMGEIFGYVTGMPQLDDGTIDFSPLQGTVLDLAGIALALPVVLLTVLWLGRRPAGTVSSVTGRLRLGWLARCLLVAVAPVALLIVGSFFVPGAEEDTSVSADWVGWRFYLFSLAVLTVLVPLQAAAEEYLFRGWLLQAVGAFFRSPWLPLLPQAALFAAAHGWGTAWGFADLLLFGLVAGWLTVRTGGLEAAVALHTLNNLSSFALAATVTDGLASDETAADMPWQLFVVDIVSMAAYAALILLWARRRHPQQTAEPITPEPWVAPPMPWPAAPYPWPTAAGPWPTAAGPWPTAAGPWPGAQGPWPATPAPLTATEPAPSHPEAPTPPGEPTPPASTPSHTATAATDPDAESERPDAGSAR